MLMGGKSILDTLSMTMMFNDPVSTPLSIGGDTEFEQEWKINPARARSKILFFIKTPFKNFVENCRNMRYLYIIGVDFSIRCK